MASQIAKLLKHHGHTRDGLIYVAESIPTIPSKYPSVVLVSGLGDIAASWATVQRLLPNHLRSFSYDRLGINKSDSTTIPRSADTLAKELHSTLQSCSVPPPYLLVAHSYAGAICREYLERYDDQVAGLVYVDANHEDSHIERRWPIEAITRMSNKDLSWNEATGLSRDHKCSPEEWEEIIAAEVKSKADRVAKVVRSPGESPLYSSSLVALGKHKQLERQALGHRPLSVIVANLTRDFRRSFAASKEAGLGTKEDHAAVDDFCDRLAAIDLRLGVDVLRLSSVHRMVLTSIAGHMVQLWEPELCVQEISWCMEHLTDS